MSQAPAWVIALRKSNRVLRDNDHVYATLEVVKAQYNRYNKNSKIRLPHYKDFNEEQINSYWADVFSSDEDTNMFISEVKRDFEPKGLNATIDRLNYYKEDLDDNWEDFKPIRELMSKKISGSKITERVTRVVNELLPFLTNKKTSGKQTAGTASGLARINVQMKDVTQEKIDNILENDFDTWDEDEQKRYLDNLNTQLGKSKRKIDELKPFFIQKYSKKMLPLIRKWKWDRELRVTVRTNKDLTPLGFKKMVEFWIIPSFTGDTRKLREDITNITGSRKGIRFRYKPIYELFGKIDTSQEIEYSKTTPQGRITTEYKVVEPFTSDMAQYYLEKVMRSSQFTDDFSPNKMVSIKKKSGFIHRSLLSLLDGKYESGIEDGSMADTFILSMDTMKFANEKYRLNYYAQKIFEVSDPTRNKYDMNSPFYVNIGTLDDFTDENDRLTPAKFKEHKQTILDALKGNTSVKDTYQQERKRLETNLRYLNQSISTSQKEFIEDLLDPDTSEDILSDIPETVADQTNNQKEILKLIQELSDKELEMRERDIDYGDKEITVHFVTVKSMFDKISRLLLLSGLEGDTELKERYNEVFEDYKEEMEEFDRVLQVHGKIFDIEFNVDDFTEGHEQDIAEITYRGLAAGFDLDDVLGGDVIKDQIDNLDNLYNVIIGAGRLYFPSDRDKLESLAQNIEPKEDLDFSTSPYASEIKEVAKIIRDMVPKLREAITKDIQDKITEILSKSLYYQQKRRKGQKRNFLQILENKGLITAVENNE